VIRVDATEPRFAVAGSVGEEPPVVQYDLSGPRIGFTMMPEGRGTRSQFGWHFESQAAPGKRGPWFIVEKVFLVGGVERSEFLPSGTLVFGVRTPSSFEFGVGPSVTIGGPAGASTAVVAAAGQTFRYGGIRVPVNLAVAMNQDTYRVSFVTGWAIRDPDGGTRRDRSWRDPRGFYGSPGQ
jgi:hypothetical protein